MNTLLRILFLLPGLICQILEMSKIGSRDLTNKLRFKKALINNGNCFDSNTTLIGRVSILGGCIINNSVINSYTYVGRNSLIQNTSIGKFCSIANDVKIGLGNHPIDYFTTSPLFYNLSNPLKTPLIENKNGFKEYLPITIGNDVWIGAASTILDGVNVGDGSIIATGSVVTKDVPPYAIVAGIPAKIIKYRFEKSKIESLLIEKWWDSSLEDVIKRIESLNK